MNTLLQCITGLYSKLLIFYPNNFRNEFAGEMQTVFKDSLNEAFRDGTLPFIIICVRELGGLPLSILREFWHEFGRKETVMVTNEKMETEASTDGGASRWGALVGTLPFALFGIASMLSRTQYPFNTAYSYLAFYAVVLLGLLIGMIKGFPHWAFSYLGWSLVFAWWWSNIGTYGLKIFGFQINYWSWQAWLPFLAAFGLALLWTRSLHPFRQLIRGIWENWTYLSLMIYTFIAFVVLIADENHHPYLFLFMTASTIILSASVWFFMQSVDMRKRAISLFSGFVLAFATSYLCDATWDRHNGYPRTIKFEFEYETVSSYAIFLVFYGLILLLPVLVGFIKSTVNKETMT